MAGLNPDFLDTLTGPLAAVYNAIEDELLQNIAKHFNTGKALATSQWELKKLAEIGKLNKENAAIIAKYAGQVPELTQMR